MSYKNRIIVNVIICSTSFPLGGRTQPCHFVSFSDIITMRLVFFTNLIDIKNFGNFITGLSRIFFQKCI